MSNYSGYTRKQYERMERYQRGLKKLESQTPQQSKTLKTISPHGNPKPASSQPETPPASSTENLGTVVGSLKTLLSKAVGLSDGERAMLNTLLLRYEAEQKRAKQRTKAAKRAALKKKQNMKQLDDTWQRERENKIEKAHQVSGFMRRSGPPLQGGAPGLGKR